MKRWSMTVVFGLVTFAMSILSAEVARADTVCSGVLSDQTIEGDLIVPGFPAPTCTLIRTTVNGNVRVQLDGRFASTMSTITGNVYAAQPFSVNILATTVGGSIIVDRGSPRGTTTINICEVTVGGNVVIQNVTTSRQIDIRPDCLNGTPNVIRGHLVLTNITTVVRPGIPAFRVDRNQIGGMLVCQGNDPPPSLSSNTYGVAFGQCAAGAST